MAKLTYGEQLKHPNWQRKRLEVLESAGWMCENCDATGKTLHVHHKRYVKGREVWDYERSDLEALCEDCHEEAHQAKARIDRVVAQFPSVMWPRLADVLTGFGSEHVDDAEWLEIVEETDGRAGQIAWFIGNFDGDTAFEIVSALRLLNPQGFLQAIRSELERVVGKIWPLAAGGEEGTPE